MRVLFVIKSVATLGGGAERVFAEITNGLHERGYDIEIVTFNAPGTKSFYALSDSITRHDLGPQSLNPRKLFSLRRKILELKPQRVVAFMPSSYVPVALALIGSGVRVIASEHNVPARYRVALAKWALLNASVPAIYYFTAVSQQMRNAYPLWIRRKMTVIQNPVSVRSGLLADVRATGRSKRLIAVGRLHPQKDHLCLIQAFGHIADVVHDWNLRILGEGAERSNLENEIQRLGLQKRVEIPGAVSDISAEYASSQLYVIPSLYESQGLATIEAMAHGLPAIGFIDCPGTNEIIINGVNGILVEPQHDRPQALAQALKLLMLDDDFRCRLASATLAQKFGPDIKSVLGHWEEILAT